jgi:hypothetical protein
MSFMITCVDGQLTSTETITVELIEAKTSWSGGRGSGLSGA